VIPAVHPVVIHEHLMDTRLAFEPYDVHPGEAGLRSGDRPGVEPLDGYPLGEEIELHYRDVMKGHRATEFRDETYMELRLATRRARLARC
jgi:hypothetical protein